MSVLRFARIIETLGSVIGFYDFMKPSITDDQTKLQNLLTGTVNRASPESSAERRIYPIPGDVYHVSSRQSCCLDASDFGIAAALRQTIVRFDHLKTRFR